MKQVIFLFALAVLLVACAETKVVQIDATQPSGTTETQDSETPATQEPASTGAAVNTGGKVATACDDPDLDDQTQPGVVEVTYGDGTTEKFYDFCPGKALGNDLILTEYVCDGTQPKTKNHICGKYQSCIEINVQSDPGKRAGFCTG